MFDKHAHTYIYIYMYLHIYKCMCIVIFIFWASILSHVNDSGFWLVSNYLGLSEKDTFRSWSMMTLILALCGFTTVLLLSLLV